MLARPIVLATLFLGITLLVGCSKGPTTVPNPFSTADRVPPPTTRAIAPGTAQPYYQSVPATTAPAFAPPATYPGLAPHASSQRPAISSVASATPGDAISIPSDNTALRFGGATKPAPFNPRQPQSLAARTATANGWISGSAPVRSPLTSGSPTMLATTPRVRLPGSGTYSRQPVSVAALQPKTQGVRITPLPGSSDTIGWR